MRHFAVTIFSGLIFFAVAYFGGVSPVSSGNVSQETNTLERYRETVLVKQGVSQDGLLLITKVSDAPAVPPRVKSYNHARTLRAFIAPNRGGLLSLYVESVKPHMYYSLAGDFVISPEYLVLAWTSETTLLFYGLSPKGELMQYVVDVYLLTLSRSLIDSTTLILAEQTPSVEMLP